MAYTKPSSPAKSQETKAIEKEERPVSKLGYEGRHVRCEVFGGGPLRELNELRDDLGLAREIVLHAARPYADMVAAYRRAAIFALMPLAQFQLVAVRRPLSYWPVQIKNLWSGARDLMPGPHGPEI